MTRENESSIFSSTNVLPKVIVPILAEFFTMIMHTFWGSMYVSPTKDLYIEELNRTIVPAEWGINYVTSSLVPAFQAGFAVWMFIVLWWKVCVINFNPAISTGLLVSGHLSPYLYVPFIVAQCLGSIVGALIAKGLKGDDNIGAFLIAEDANIPVILVCEIMITGIMCFFTDVMVGDSSYDQQTGPFAIGMTVFQGIIAGRWVGAGGLNPARAIGPAVVLGGEAWTHHWVWWVGDLTGAIIFSLIYRCFFAPLNVAWFALPFKKKDQISHSQDSTKGSRESFQDIPRSSS